jgi:amidase
MSGTFISRCETSGRGVRLAVKDLIDMAGDVTTAGCRALAERAEPAVVDAACLAGARAARARIVGRTNLHELAFGVSGINPWYGTPLNPLDPRRVPGGSSSGSAVAVASGEAEVAYGTDSGGSIRIPAACCGVAGLKSTAGRVSLHGVRPLAPSLDTVGPMARDVNGLTLGMQLLEPAFSVAAGGADVVVGRLAVEADPRITGALDRALRLSGWQGRPLELPMWRAATAWAATLLIAEAWQSNAALLAANPEGIGADVAARLARGAAVESATLAAARRVQRDWSVALAQVFSTVDVVVTPTLTIFPPRPEAADQLLGARCTLPVNLAGVPAVSLPVPAVGGFPASLQLVGPAGGEERLLAAAAHLEAAVAAG